jgi:phosphopantothenoylcysteine decarboxylase/phosphopantothenate--cysteine ligase
MAEGRRIVLGVTGGVAAYKAAYIARRLIERGHEVRVVMTESAQNFIGTSTFAAITGHEPVTTLFGSEDVSPHTTLGQWADAIVVAPATASTISRLAAGQSSDALVATVLASRAPVIVAPAMHTEMWEQPATVSNIDRLTAYGYRVVEPEVGALAGGDVGLGRLADPETILAAIDGVFPVADMAGLRVLVTAGGTREPLDPVRYIGNRSSGKMGNALAEVAAERGAEILLVTAAQPIEAPGIKIVQIDTAEEMAASVWAEASNCDIAIMAAAVADFKPRTTHASKMRRIDGVPTIELEPTPDVLKGVHEMSPRPFLVGFAAEVGSLDAATAKARAKGVDLLVANDVTSPGAGFESDTNKIRFVFRDGSTQDLPVLPKKEVASAIWDTVLRLRDEP